MAGQGTLKIPGSRIPPAPRTGASGTPVRPRIIRAMVLTQRAYEAAGKELDKLLDVVSEGAKSGRPPPPHEPYHVKDPEGGRR